MEPVLYVFCSYLAIAVECCSGHVIGCGHCLDALFVGFYMISTCTLCMCIPFLQGLGKVAPATQVPMHLCHICGNTLPHVCETIICGASPRSAA